MNRNENRRQDLSRHSVSGRRGAVVRSAWSMAEALESRRLLSSAVLHSPAPSEAGGQDGPVAINAGGPTAGSFAADNSFSGGHTMGTTAAIDVSGVTDPAPQAVYQTERTGSFTYTIRGLTAGDAYTVNLDFSEIQLDAAGKRLFNVAIDGVRVLHKFDVFATADGEDIAVDESFSATANRKGDIAIAFTGVKNKAIVSGIEVIPVATVSTGPTPGTPAAQADLGVTITDGQTAVLAGATDTYTIVVTNDGPDADSTAQIDDTWPSNFTGVTYSYTTTGGAVVTHTNGIGTISDTADMPAASTITYTATGTVAALTSPGPGTLSDTVTVGTGNSATDPNPVNNSATDTDSVNAQEADIAITLTDGKTAVIGGSTDTYTIVVSNNGPDACQGASITDGWPINFTGVTYSYSTTGGAVVTHTNGTGNISDTADLPPGSTITYTATGTVATLNNPSPATLSDTATVSGGSVTDPNESNNSASDVDTVNAPAPVADLAVTLTDGKTTVTAGSTDTYTIVVTNNGPDADSTAEIDDSWPSNFTGVTYSYTTTGGAVVTQTNGVGTIGDTADMPAGSTITYTATGTVAMLTSPGPGQLSDGVTVSAGSGATDPNLANNGVAKTDVVNEPGQEADLAVTLTDGKTSIAPGATDTYTIVVTNNGPDADNSAQLTDQFPAAFLNPTYTESTTGGAVVLSTHGAGTIGDELELPAGSTVTYTVTGTVSTSASGTLSDTASVSGADDPNLANNSATDTDAIT